MRQQEFSRQRSHVIKVLPCRLGCYTIFPGHIEQIHATRLSAPNNYFMHLAYTTSLTTYESCKIDLWGSHSMRGGCFICRLQKIPSCQQHSTSTCLISTPPIHKHYLPCIKNSECSLISDMNIFDT